MSRFTHPIRVAVFLVVAAAASCRGPAPGPVPVTAAEIEAHIRFLSDDALEGRGLGSRGIAMAADYQEDHFKTFGLEPAFGPSYRQSFELRAAKPDPGATLEVSGPAGTVGFRLADDFVVATEREDAPPEVEAELVYGGYLIQAPERTWDDVKGYDFRGRVILCEVNEPGNMPGGLFEGEDMTYYGRWPHKFEKAAALGAAGVLIVHNTKGAAYGWEVVRNGWAGERFFLPDRNPQLLFQGWVSEATAEAILALAHLKRPDLVAKAETPQFAPVPLGLRVRVRERPAFRSVEGVNVGAFLRGRHKDARDQTVIVSAHYDHFGRDERLEGDQIYNGAVDNCSATAAMLALAAFYAQRPEDLKVNLLFAGVTAEEQLILGSDYLARHLPVPASEVLADINFEMTNVWGETEDVFAIGANLSDLDDICRRAAEALGLRYTADRTGRLGYVFRSDQLSFARAGIPGVWLHQGETAKGPDKGLVQRKFMDYQQTKYHKVSDEIGPDWDYAGTLQIIAWAREIIRLLAESPAPPRWKPASAFQRPGRP